MAPVDIAAALAKKITTAGRASERKTNPVPPILRCR
jgi:hypothetical protein